MEEAEIKSGTLFKKEKKAWKEFTFALVGQTLYWFKPSKDPKKRGKAKGTLPIKQAFIKDMSGNAESQPYAHAFQIVKTDQIVHLAAASEDENLSWMNLLKRAALGEKESRETVQIQDELRKIGHEIDEKDLEFASGEDVIGSGASGIVRKGLWLKSTEVAVKALKNVPEFTDPKELISFYKEIEVLSKLRHVNIVQMYGFCKKNSYICLVTEFVRGGNLSECLKTKDKYPMDLALQIEIAMNIVRGMVYLHNQSVIHRDLKPANILIENWTEGRLKVCDFGLSRVRKHEEKNEDNALGSPQYAAPELNTDDHTEKVDVFSFSIILWEIAFRQQPWPEVKFGWEFSDRYQGGQRPPMPASSPFNALIEKCWETDPKKRPSFAGVYEELETIRKANPEATLNNPNRLANFPTPKSPQQLRTTASSVSLKVEKPPAGAEVGVTRVFGNQPKIPWSKFSGALGSALNTTNSSLQKLEYIFNDNGMVSREVWDSFLIWFSPLAQPDLYQTSDENTNGGYDIDSILEICTPSWFHGFLSSADAQRGLKGKRDGTFLFRFSTSNPGCYALSAAYSGTVGHWRISCQKDPGQPATFKIDGRDYKSLAEIVSSHKFGQEALKIKQPRPGQASSCFLGDPWPREQHGIEEGNEYYQNVKK